MSVNIKIVFFFIFTAVISLWTGFPVEDALLARELIAEEDMADLFDLSLEELRDVKISVASKFLESELLVGSSVSEISPQHWQRLGARRLTDALINQTTIMILPGMAGYNPIYIRGYAAEVSGFVPLLDGVPVLSCMSGSAAFLSNFGLGTLNGIEVIKGPGSAIYGSDAFHGVVAYNTFASNEDFYYAEAAGAYPLYGDASMQVSHGLADGHVRIDMASSLAGQNVLDLDYPYQHGFFPADIFYPGQPGQVPGEGTGVRENKYHTETGVFKLTFLPVERTRIRVGANVARNKFDGFPGPSTVIGNLKERDTASQDSLFLMGTGTVSCLFDNDISLDTKGYYWWQESTAVLNVDEFGAFNHTVMGEYHAGVDLIIKQQDNAVNLQWLLAYSFASMKIQTAETNGYNALLGKVTSHYNELYNGFTRDIHSIYAQAKWGVIKDRLYLLLGGRVDEYSDFGRQLTPRGGLIYLPTDRSSVKALYGRGFKAGKGYELFGIMNYAKGDLNIKPEVIDVYELIFMYQTDKLKTTVNGFYSYWKDGIIRKAAPEFLPEFRLAYVNEGKNISYGGEFNLLYLLDPFTAELGFSYVESSALDVADPNDATHMVDQAYAAFPGYFINVGLYYTISPWAIHVYLNNRLYLNMKDTHYGRDSDPGDLPPYWRTDLNLSKVIGEKVKVIVDIRNLFDRENRVPSIYGAKDGVGEAGISALLRVCYEF